MNDTYDCIVVGGGAAGLSAALTLGRARRRTLLVDAGGQSNLAAHGIGGLLGHDGRPPAALYAAGRDELSAYPAVTIRHDTVAAIADESSDGEPLFSATLAGGEVARTRRVLLAGGMEYEYTPLPGLAERWGGAVFHCPFCHGWEVRERPLAVLSPGSVGVHQALMLTAWSEDVTLLNGGGVLSDDERDRLARAGVRVEDRTALAVEGPADGIEAITLEGGGSIPCGGLLVRTLLRHRSRLAIDLGVACGESTPLAEDPVIVDAMGLTSVPGVAAAGDLLGRPPSVQSAMATGSMAGAGLVASLTLG